MEHGAWDPGHLTGSHRGASHGAHRTALPPSKPPMPPRRPVGTIRAYSPNGAPKARIWAHRAAHGRKVLRAPSPHRDAPEFRRIPQLTRQSFDGFRNIGACSQRIPQCNYPVTGLLSFALCNYPASVAKRGTPGDPKRGTAVNVYIEQTYE